MSDAESHSLPRAMKTGRTGENLGTWLEWTQVSVLESLLRPHGSRLGWKLVCANSFKLCG